MDSNTNKSDERGGSTGGDVKSTGLVTPGAQIVKEKSAAQSLGEKLVLEAVGEPKATENLPKEPQNDQTIKPETTPPQNAPQSVTEPATAGKSQESNRNPDGTFKKGMSGNPAGPKKGTKHLTTMLKEFLQGMDKSGESYEKLLTKRVAKKAIEEGSERMIEFIYDRIEGKPKQTIDVVVQEELTPEQKAKLDKMLGIE